MRLSRGAAILGAALLSSVFLTCGGGARGPGDSGAPTAEVGNPASRRPGLIVLVTLSGLRPDVVGALGGEGSWTPHIDAFAEQADWVGSAVTASSAPAASLASLMTGVSPWQHQVLGAEPAPPRSGIMLLPEALGRVGYRSRAHVPLDYDLDRYGLLDGFDEVTEIEPLELAESLQSRAAESKFVWFHLREANVAYQRRDVELPRLAGRSAGLLWRLPAWRLLSFADPRIPLPTEERAIAWELFRHEVAWADEQVGRILNALRNGGQWDRAWVIVTASQGTELGEHGQVLYSQNLGRESIEVPVIVKLPRSSVRPLAVPETQRISQHRLWATLVEAAGGETAPVHAPSLFRPATPPMLSELYRRNGVNEFSLVEGDLQLLWSARFAPEEADFYRAQLAMSGGRPPISEPPRDVLARLARAFRQTLPLSGPEGGEPPELRLERWKEDGSVAAIEDPVREREMAGRLRRAWLRFVDRERSLEEESSLSRSSE